VTASNPEFETDCIRRILAGEKHLFHALIEPCERAIYFLLLSLLRNEAEAEDAAQDTAIKVYLNLKSFRGDSQFGPGCCRLRGTRGWADCARREAAERIRWTRKRMNKQGLYPGDSDQLARSAFGGAGAEGTGRDAAAGD